MRGTYAFSVMEFWRSFEVTNFGPVRDSIADPCVQDSHVEARRRGVRSCILSEATSTSNRRTSNQSSKIKRRQEVKYLPVWPFPSPEHAILVAYRAPRSILHNSCDLLEEYCQCGDLEGSNADRCLRSLGGLGPKPFSPGCLPHLPLRHNTTEVLMTASGTSPVSFNRVNGSIGQGICVFGKLLSRLYR